MRKTTIAGSVAAAGLAASVAALGLTGTAGTAATDGVGAGTVSTSVVDATLGDLLGVRLLEDVASATTDPKIGTVGASSVFRQVTLSSSITDHEPSLNQVVGEHKVAAPAGPTDLTTSALDLSSVNLPAVVNGAVDPLVLKALAAPSSLTSSTAKITNVELLGGLASLGVLDALDSTGSAPASADAGRTMKLDTLSMLDLGKLLQGLGLDVLGLPLSVVSALVKSTGLTPDLQGSADVATLVTSLSDSIGVLQDTVDTNVTTDLLAAITATGLPAPLRPALNDVINGVGGSIADLQATLTDLITSVVTQLEAVTILKVNGLEIDTVAKAADTVSGSVATATGKITSLQVGPTTLTGVDPAAPASAVDDLVARLGASLTTLLAPLGFTDLLSVKLFDRQTGVSETSGVVKAVASITGLDVKLSPPSIAALTPLDNPPGSIGSHLPPPIQSGRTTARRAAARALTALAAQNPLDAVLSSGLSEAPLLSRGMELKVGTVASQSLHSAPAAPATTTTTKAPSTPTTAAPEAPAPAVQPTPTTTAGTPTPAGSLPRTGSEGTRLAWLAMGLGALALGARRLRRSARP
jgi:hypothetical protein